MISDCVLTSLYPWCTELAAATAGWLREYCLFYEWTYPGLKLLSLDIIALWEVFHLAVIEVTWRLYCKQENNVGLFIFVISW